MFFAPDVIAAPYPATSPLNENGFYVGSVVPAATASLLPKTIQVCHCESHTFISVG